MIKLKRFIFTIFLVFVGITISEVYAGLRDYIVTVRPVYNEKTIGVITEYGNRLEKFGYIGSSKIGNDYKEQNIFSTGFFIKAKNSKVYMLTTKNIVLESMYVKAEIYTAEGQQTVLDGGKIVAVDDKFDLALIMFPDSLNLKSAFEFADELPSDGETIYSAGYPIVSGKPSWQFSEGIISNSFFNMEDFDEDYKNIVIQHTAQIDRGSYGSPLLIKSKSSTGYSVIGLNTWSVARRDNVNLAIRYTDIENFVETALSKREIHDSVELANVANQFSIDASLGYKNVLKYISYDYISKLKIDNFFEFYDKAPIEIQNDIKQAFENGNFFEGIRMGLTNVVYSHFAKNKSKIKFISVIKDSLSNNEMTTKFLIADKLVYITWIIEHNKFRINNISDLKFFDINKKIGKTYNFSYQLSAGANIIIPFTDAEETGFGFDFDFMMPFIENAYVGASFYKFSHMAYKKRFDYNLYQDVITDTGFTNYTEFGIHVGYQYPFQISKFFILPFVKGFVGSYMSGIEEFTAHLSYGVKVAYELNDKSYLIFKANMTPRSVKDDDFFEDYNDYFDGLMKLGSFNSINFGLSYAIRFDIYDKNPFMQSYKF